MPKKRLIDRLFESLSEREDVVVEMDGFSDNSGSWIEIKPSDISVCNGYYISQVLSFNGKGTKLLEVNTYKNKFEIHTDSEKIK